MEFDVRLTEKSVFKFLVQRAYSGQYGRMSLLGGIILIILGVIVLQQGDNEPIYAIILFVLGILLPCSVPFNIKKQAKASVNVALPEHYILEDEHMVYSHFGNSMVISWKKIGQIYEYPEGILIDLKSNQITLIPKTCVFDIYDEIKENLSRHSEIIQRSGKLLRFEQ